MGEEGGKGLQEPELAKVILHGEPGEWSYGRDEKGVRTAYREWDGVLVVVKETGEHLVVAVSGLGRIDYEKVVENEQTREVTYNLTGIQMGDGLKLSPYSNNDYKFSWTAAGKEHTCIIPGCSYNYIGMQGGFWGRMESDLQPSDYQFILSVKSEPVQMDIEI